MWIFDTERDRLLKDWLPLLTCGLVAWLAFIILGQTPIVRASGLALVIVGVAATMRWLGAVLALAGGLALAFSPAFWSQTGGGDAGPATIVIALGAAGLFTAVVILASKRMDIAFALGVVIFAVLFWSQVGTPRSLRLTSLLTAWLLYLIGDMLLRSNPRPDERQPERPTRRYTLGMLLLFSIGVLNDPLFTLLGPAIVITLLVSHARIHLLYWTILLGIIGYGIVSIVDNFLNPAAPLLILDLWRDPDRWIEMLGLVIDQFTIWGVILGIIGLVRLSRWYPPLGTVSMIAYAAYVVFGLIYIGGDRAVLLLPLLMIQVIWMTYAAFTFGQWIEKTVHSQGHIVRWVTSAVYMLLPLALLWQLSSGL